MITWMQKHKKWLVITIWISTIAFVGAGFVGWGSYNYNRSSSNVATVGDKVIQIKDLNNEYSNLYRQYQQMFGAKFNNEMAKQFDLQGVALNNLIQKFLLLNLADKYGISATKKEIAERLVKISAFIKNGKFDKATYVQVLKQNRTNPTDFEAQIGQEITLQKLVNIFSSTTNKNIVKIFDKVLGEKDKVAVKVLKLDDIKVTATQKAIKKYWEANKNRYKSIKKYQINIEQIALGDNPKQSKKTALRKYLAIKKGTDNFKQQLTIDANTAFIGAENLQKITSSKVGKLLKPLKTDDHYIIVKLLKVIEPKVLDFDSVKQTVKQDYITSQKRTLLTKARDNAMQNFNGKDLGYVSRKTDSLKIDGLTKDEVKKVLQSIFNTTTKTDFVELANKTVVYQILDTKLGEYQKDQEFALTQQLDKVQDQILLSTLLEKLKTKYEIKTNFKVK